jgi:hypothetical protein
MFWGGKSKTYKLKSFKKLLKEKNNAWRIPLYGFCAD